MAFKCPSCPERDGQTPTASTVSRSFLLAVFA